MKPHAGMVIVGCLALAVVACGGSSSGGDDNSPPILPPSGTGAVIVHVASPSGVPAAGVDIGLFDGMSELVVTTDGDGQAEFSRFPAGPADVGIYESGFHYANHAVTVAKNSTVEVSLEVLRAIEATPVILAAHSTVADGGRTLAVDLDVAVLGEDGVPIATLTAADFGLLGSDCEWMWCVMAADGAPLSGSYGTEVDAGGFGWIAAESAPSAASATALLIENSTAVLEFDPASRHSAAAHAFLDSVTAPDTVALASYYGSFWMPILETYGSFTSDGTTFHAALDGLSRDDAYLNPLHEVLGRMLSWTAEQASVGQKDLVLVSGKWSLPDDGCGSYPYCSHQTRAALAESALGLALPVTGLGGTNMVADIAARTGGAYVDIVHPEQYAIAYQNLKAITSRNLAFNRVRFVLNANVDGLFASGRTVWTYAQLRIGTDTVLAFPVVVAIP